MGAVVEFFFYFHSSNRNRSAGLGLHRTRDGQWECFFCHFVFFLHGALFFWTCEATGGPNVAPRDVVAHLWAYYENGRSDASEGT